MDEAQSRRIAGLLGPTITVQNQVELQIMKSKQPHLVGRCFRAIN